MYILFGCHPENGPKVRNIGHAACRCHTSAHQAEFLRQGEKCFLITGDVYRRDSVDKTHYPVFHQMEGFRVFTANEVATSGMSGVQAFSHCLLCTS
jgi:phenylalanyl-tRNA synthetase alpha subunit